MWNLATDKTDREIPLSNAGWAALSETYAGLIAERLRPDVRWLDGGCGFRVLEDGLDLLEDWLMGQCAMAVGMDVHVQANRNIRLLVEGSLYALPFSDCSFDLITCNMVVEHLKDPIGALAQISRCLAPGGAVVISTPNLLNYGVMANALCTHILPEKWRLQLVRAADNREPKDIFPVCYKANTLSRLTHLCVESGLQIHKALTLDQQGPFFKKTGKLESIFMRLTPTLRLLVCAHKPMLRHPPDQWAPLSTET